VGPVYEIVEPDMLEQIKSKAKEIQNSPEWAQRLRDSARRAEESIKNPPPVEGLSPAMRKRTHYFDPTVVATEDVRLPNGQLLVPAGTRANPLEQVPWRSTYFFLDGRDPRQVAEVKKLRWSKQVLLKPILVAGSPIELQKELKTKVYFDQHGLLVHQFGIQAVPATVRQEGLRLRIDEFPAGEGAK
jgi:conjugal transfer pilus assembly protein TraW